MEQAHCRPEDVDDAQFYENFTGPVLMALCEMGFARPEGIEEFVSGGRLVGPDAAFPFNRIDALPSSVYSCIICAGVK